MDYDVIIARYGEVGLKSPRIRSRFERQLVYNIKSSFKCDIDVNQARVFIFPENFEEALSKLSKVFGIVSFSPAISTHSTHEAIDEAVAKYVDYLVENGLINGNTQFAIRCRRFGNHDFTSQEMGAYAGATVVRKLGCPVNLSNPQLEIFLEVREDETYIYHDKIRGTGGLPLGTQGKVVSLLSTGIDSPVATYLMMKRGCEIIAVHFENYPFTKKEATEKFEKIVAKLKEYSKGVPFNYKIISFGDYLQKSKDDAPDKMTCVLCKSGMFKIAERIATNENALGIVDGASVGQVASQTLPNILATRDEIQIPILSPLIGLDKTEIQEIAKKIGTFEISKVDDGGCSAVPRYPETRADLERVRTAKKDMSQDKVIDDIIDSIY
ncbi:MAG: tRNA uracil 4-sulfurtransferase ThiI [Methanobacteriaceae archaeon]